MAAGPPLWAGERLGRAVAGMAVAGGTSLRADERLGRAVVGMAVEWS